ncbi:MAG: quinolinate synthase NadA [Myxococcota bacterium]
MEQPGSQDAFPSLIIGADGFEPMGSFAEAQAQFLAPDPATVGELERLLREKKAGVVAHFYMDPELQGVLSACDWPHVHISDSLAMADRAVRMAEEGAEVIVVLGVDFMSENVRAMLDAAGRSDVPVYRVASDPIGCSLAEAAEARAYGAWLTRAAQVPSSLHVIYINTSLRVKAKSHALVPTITCTSSNVVQMILQAFAQVPDLSVWFGPDTYMGENLRHLFESLAEMDDAAIAALHPAHDRESVRALLARFHHFEQGHCIVHHMFGADVVKRVREQYPDAHVTAHLEVPGEMFALGMEGQRRGQGVVGSTSNILHFIAGKVEEAVSNDQPGRLQFILGTEAGMITAIVRRVQGILREHRAEGGPEVDVEIVFPVAGEAIATTADRELQVVPGVAAGEGCTVAGGCATCPYMKMNSLDALVDLLRRVGDAGPQELSAFEPKKYVERVAGRTMADLGGEPILHMRAYQRTGRLPDALLEDIRARRLQSA